MGQTLSRGSLVASAVTGLALLGGATGSYGLRHRDVLSVHPALQDGAAVEYSDLLPEGYEAWDAYDAQEFAQAWVDIGGTTGDPDSGYAVFRYVTERFLMDATFYQDESFETIGRLTTPGHRVRSEAEHTFIQSQLETTFLARVEAEASGGAMDFEAMRVAVDSLRTIGVSQTERAALVATWCAGHDPASMTTRELAVLCSFLRDSAVDPGNMTAVYDGTITIPQAGEYTISRYLNAGATFRGDWVEVRIGGQVVLDTRPNEDGDATTRAPINLAAGAQPFTATFFRGDDAGVDGDLPGVGPVEHVLRWQLTDTPGAGGPVLIPGSAFGQTGLHASYYAGSLLPGEAGELVAEQTVPCVDRMGSSFAQRHGALLDQIRGQLTSPQRVAGWYQELADDPLGSVEALPWVYRNACEVLGATDRAALTDALCGQHPDWVGSMDSGWAMKTAMWSLAGVPPEAGGDGAMLTLVGTWAANRPRFQTQIGAYPSWGPTGYLKINDDAYAHLGYVLGGHESQWPVMAAICEQCMTENGGPTSGGCDIEILKLYLETAKIASDSTRGWGSGGGLREVTAYVDQALEDDTLIGDARATWLVARGICEEAKARDAIPAPTAGRRYFELAFSSAVSIEVKFWVLGEISSRLASMGNEDELGSLLSAVGAQFPAEDQQEAIAQWTAKAADLARGYERSMDHQVVERQIEIVASLQVRLDHAVSNGDELGQARYQRLLNQGEQALAELETSFSDSWGE